MPKSRVKIGPRSRRRRAIPRNRVRRFGHTGCVSRKGDPIKIPLTTDQAINALIRVKPTADMPRPGKKSAINKKRANRAK
jgi:hypothetical protein